MCQSRTRSQVTYGEHRVSCPSAGVDHHEATLIEGRTGIGQPDKVAVWAAANHHGHPVRRNDGLTIGAGHEDAGVIEADSGAVQADPHPQLA